MRAAPVFLLATSLVSFPLAGCLDRSCTLIGCHEGAELQLAYPFSATETLAGGTVRVCRNSLCNVEQVISSGAGLALAAPYDTHVRVVEASFQDLVLAIRIDGWMVDLKDGDLYTLELRDRNGAVVASKEWSAKYEHVYPNGEDCDDGCQLAVLD